jgi:glucose-6-phosphate isomerase
MKIDLSSLKISSEKEFPQNDKIREGFEKNFRGGNYHFIKGIYEDRIFREMERLKYVKAFKTMLHIGIGGSALAPLVIKRAFEREIKGKNFYLIENLDEWELQRILSGIDPKSLCLHVVSKSGNTVETVANFFYIYGWLIRKIGEKKVRERVFITTNPEGGFLRELALKEGFPLLKIPGELTGRFSALSPVGLFPALFLGIRWKEMINGARETFEALKEKRPDENPVLKSAEFILHQYENENKNVFVLMPYSERLEVFSRWFVQLWAESLGKNGKGQTPLCGKGVTDQHTILQLIIDGPPDKIVCLMKIKEKGRLRVGRIGKICPPEFMMNFSISEIRDAEYYGTTNSIKNKGIPVLELEMESLNPYMMGRLFIFFCSLVSLLGEGLGINPFDQPAVEESKRLAREYLKNKKSLDL